MDSYAQPQQNQQGIIQPQIVQSGFNAPGLFQSDPEKSWVDKLLGVNEINDIKEIITKPLITRQDTHQLMLLTNAIESKLVNLNEHERRELGNFLIFLSNRIRMMDTMFDIEQKIMNKVGLYANLNDSSIKKFEGIHYKMSHNLKYLFTIFTFPSRTSLSLQAFAFKNFVTTKYDIGYTGLNQNYSGEAQKPGGLNLFGGRK